MHFSPEFCAHGGPRIGAPHEFTNQSGRAPLSDSGGPSQLEAWSRFSGKSFRQLARGSRAVRDITVFCCLVAFFFGGGSLSFPSHSTNKAGRLCLSSLTYICVRITFHFPCCFPRESITSGNMSFPASEEANSFHPSAGTYHGDSDLQLERSLANCQWKPISCPFSRVPVLGWFTRNQQEHVHLRFALEERALVCGFFGH